MESRPAESRLAVIMVADVADYSRLMGEDENKAIAAIRELKQSLFEPKVAEHGGEVLKRMGDGWIVAFSSVSAAVRAAMAAQEGLAGHPVIRLRIGLHIGEIVFDETDFHGAGVNLAERLQTEAPPGGVMISQDLYRQLTGELAEAFTDAGSFKLKNIAQPVESFQWRPQQRRAGGAEKLPTIAVEAFPAAPDEGDARAAAADLRDQLITRLSRRTGIRVLDENSGAGPEDADYLLRGRLRLTGTKGRFNLALILRGEGRPVWSQSYEGETEDAFQFCDDTVERADADLRLQINAFDAERIANLPDEELSVSELRARAAHAFYKATLESWDYGKRLLERALRLNPDDPMANAMYGEAVLTLTAAKWEPLPEETLDRLESNLDCAVEASPRSDYVFWARGLFRVYGRPDHAGALKDVRRTLKLSPSYAPGYELLGLAHLLGGDYTEAEEALQKAVDLSQSDPLLPYRLYLHGLALVLADRAEDAAEVIEEAVQLRPNVWAYRRLQAIALEKAGRKEAAGKAEARAKQLPREPAILAPRPHLPESESALVEALAPGG